MPRVTDAPVSGSLCGIGFFVVGGGGSSPGGSAGGSTMSVQSQDVKILKEQLDNLDAEIAQVGGTVARTVYVRPQDA